MSIIEAQLNNLSRRETSALETFVAMLQARFGPQLVDVLLFGSKARGDAGPGSDIDVLVVLDTSQAKQLGEARALGFDILLTHQVFLSIRAMSRRQFQELADMDSLFFRNLMKDGISFLPAPA